MIGGREDDVIFQEMREFPGEDRGKSRASVRDDVVMEAKLRKYMVKKDVGYIHGGCSFVARAENYPFQKAMVYHDWNRIKAMGDGKVSNEIHRDLLEGAGALGGDRGEWGMGRMSIDHISLAGSIASNEFVNEGGHARPPVVLLKEGDDAEITAISAGQRFMDIFE